MTVKLKEVGSIHGIILDGVWQVSCGEFCIIVRYEDGRVLSYSTDEYFLVSVTA